MRKSFTKIVLLIISLLLVFSMTACGEGDKSTVEEATIVSINVDSSTIPLDEVAGEVSLGTMKLGVVMSDDTINIVDVTNNMVALVDRYKLLKSGTHNILLNYEGFSVKFTLTLKEAPIKEYTLTVINGALKGEVPVDGAWTGTIVEGGRVTIVAIDRSNEGYHFSSWKIQGTIVDDERAYDITVTDNVTITAEYTLEKHKVNFNSNGGTYVSQIEAREILEQPVSTKEEFVFVGWTESDSGDTNTLVSFPYTIVKNTILNAVWESLGLVYDKEPTAYGYTITDYTYTGTRTDLVIPEKHGGYLITKISKEAFNEATALRNITISEHISIIEDYAFSQCVNLQNFYVDSKNDKFSVINGVLYDGETLIAYPAGKMRASFEVKDVAQIGNGAFYNANIGSISIKSTLTKIGDNAFNSRTIDNVTFPFDVPSQMANVETIFNDSINNIFIEQTIFINNYKNHPSFANYKEKIKVLEYNTIINIYEEFLYKVITRDLDGIETSTIEIIGVERNTKSLALPIIRIEGKDITSIGSYAFSYAYDLQNINISHQSKIDRILVGAFDNTKWQLQPDHNNIVNGLIIINNKLFRCLEDRKEYTIPYTVTRIAEESFSNMTKLERVLFEDDLSGNRHITTIDARAFKNCHNLNTIEIPKTIKRIGENAFENTRLGNFSMATDSVLEKIEPFAFLNASNLKSISIGNETKDIGKGAFNGCYSLEQILINGEKDNSNNMFVVKDGVLFQKNKDLEIQSIIDNFGRILHTYPAGKIDDIYQVPFDEETGVGVTHINEYAFYYSNLAAIVLPTTIESILKNTFVVPQLVYLEFTAEIQVTNFAILFSTYSPQHIFISETDSREYGTFGAPAGMIKKKSTLESIDNLVGIIQNTNGQNFIYRYDSDGVFIIGADRGVDTLQVPSLAQIGDASIQVVGIGSYAFIGAIMQEIDLPPTIQTIKAYAFYYSSALKRIISRADAVPSLEYIDDDESPEQILSFNPITIVENALIFVPTGKAEEYINGWPTTEDFVIIIGEQPQIIFETNGGASAILLDLISGEPIDLSTLDIIDRSPFTTKDGYLFNGWYENINFEGEAVSFPYKKYKNVTLYANWDVRSFTVIFNTADGDMETLDATVNYGEFYDFDVPTLLGYKFVGWFDINRRQFTDENGAEFGSGGWNVDADVTLIANWSNQEYTITYDKNDGINNDDPSTKTVLYGQNYVLEIPTREGYNFNGWKDAQGNQLAYITTGESIKPWKYTTDITIYASWKPLSFSVSFNTVFEGSTQFPPQTVVFGQSFKFPIPEMENSVFFGWYDGYGGTGIQYTNQLGESVRVWDKAGIDIIVYAQWPIDITSVDKFELIRNNPEGSYILTNDIELSEEWVPIGLNEEAPFTGILDGNGYSIMKMTIMNENLGYVGLIGYNKGIIRNLNLGIKYINNEPDLTGNATINITSTNVDYENLYIGGIAGYNDTMGLIINCQVAIKISAETAYKNRDMYVGGLVGYNKGEIKDSYVITNLSAIINQTPEDSGNSFVGTLVGYHKLLAKIESCRYERVVGSPITQTKAYGNESNTDDFGIYIDTTGTTSQRDW